MNYNRIRDIRTELDRHMARRKQRGSGPPEAVGPGMMTAPDLAAYIGCNIKTAYTYLRGLPALRSGKHIYYHIRDVAIRLVQKEMEATS